MEKELVSIYVETMLLRLLREPEGSEGQSVSRSFAERRAMHDELRRVALEEPADRTEIG